MCLILTESTTTKHDNYFSFVHGERVRDADRAMSSTGDSSMATTASFHHRMPNLQLLHNENKKNFVDSLASSGRRRHKRRLRSTDKAMNGITKTNTLEITAMYTTHQSNGDIEV